jgi:hypothetical protein
MAVSEKRIIAALIDELGSLDRELATFRKKEERVKVIRAELVARLELSPEDSVSADGSRYVATIGESCIKRSVADMPGLFSMLGKQTFLENCSFGIERIDYLLDASLRQKVLEEKRTGVRLWKTTQKAVFAKSA